MFAIVWRRPDVVSVGCNNKSARNVGKVIPKVRNHVYGEFPYIFSGVDAIQIEMVGISLSFYHVQNIMYPARLD